MSGHLGGLALGDWHMAGGGWGGTDMLMTNEIGESL